MISPTLRSQQGAALIISMLLLTVLTLLSISAMNSAALQERMSGHLRDSQLAFESADAALRDREQWLDNQPQPPPPCASVAVGCELFDPAALDALESSDGSPWWRASDNSWWQQHGLDFIANGQDLPQSADDPRSVIELLERVPDSLVIGVAPPSSRTYYRITARGVGGSLWAQTVVQSTFVKQTD
ncbi:MAG: PilX N-terminal domain-containing pilus assembly protein [Gammaproteobacteria bacterium]|nr:PilX N-terminal domain-containing pilus assembly protein [Gammaproteobacteria bacterium]